MPVMVPITTGVVAVNLWRQQQETKPRCVAGVIVALSLVLTRLCASGSGRERRGRGRVG